MTTSVQKILKEIDEKTPSPSSLSYFYRGEPEEYPEVSSKLYRDIEKHNKRVEEGGYKRDPLKLYKAIALDEQGLTQLQQHELIIHRKHTRHSEYGTAHPCEVIVKNRILNQYSDGDLHSLTEIQHMGGSTVLIDFTWNSDVALYFACCKSRDEDGRVIILAANRDKTYSVQTHRADGRVTTHSADIPSTSMAVLEPSYPQNRVIAQRSVFVLPNQGYLDPELIDFKTVIIPRNSKGQILEYLENKKGITADHLYNDVTGYVEDQKNRFIQGKFDPKVKSFYRHIV